MLENVPEANVSTSTTEEYFLKDFVRQKQRHGSTHHHKTPKVTKRRAEINTLVTGESSLSCGPIQ